jgi:cytochrome c oxidase cbb3-type subunit 1
VKATYPFYAIRLLGGLLYLGGMLVMTYNMVKTIANAKTADTMIPAPAHA